ncbi:hypothetical protein GCM10009642_39440 [Nocardiopsis metallicus]
MPVPWSESLPQFSLAGTLLTVLLLFFAAFGEPLLGRRAFSWLSRRRDGDERALGLLYAVTVAIHVLWGLMVLVVLLVSPALNLVDLGLRTPDAFGPIVGAAIGGLIALAAFWVLVNGLPTRERFPVLGKLSGGKGGRGKPGRRAKPGDADAEGTEGRGRKGHRGRRGAAKPMTLPEPGREQYLLLPRTGRERGLAAGMAVTGGVFGELLYRGLFITLVASMGVPLWIAAVLSIVVFAVAHAYQGWWGLLSAGFSGTLFTILYLGTGSLVIPVLVHVALNLRSVVFPPAADREAAHEAYRSGDRYDDEYDEYEYDGYEGDGYEDRGHGDTEYGEDDYGRTGEFEAVEADRTENEPMAAAVPAGPPAPPLQQGPPSAGTPPFGQSAPYPGPHNPNPHNPGPRPPQPGPGHFQQASPPPYRPTPQQPPQHRPPQGLPQGPPPGYGQQPPQQPPQPPQGPPPAYPHPSAPPSSDGGDFRSGPGPAADQGGHRLYPDEWIDRHHGPEGDTPGPGSPPRD